jgi:hypothetical protein
MGFVFFPRDDSRKVREGDLQLMYAAVKKIRVSPVHLLVEHWLATPNLKGAVGCTSLVTRITFGLNLLENASLEYINEFRSYIGYEHFSHAHLLKREGDGLYMLYPRGRIWLPNPELSPYSVRTLLIDFQVSPVNLRAPQRAASARMAYQLEPQWHSADPSPERPAHTSYTGWCQPEPRILRTPWEYQAPQQEEDGWPQGDEEQ